MKKLTVSTTKLRDLSTDALKQVAGGQLSVGQLPLQPVGNPLRTRVGR